MRPPLDEIVAFLRTTPVRCSTERQAQDDLQAALEAARIAFSREYRLSASDRPDFMVGGIAIELKARRQVSKPDVLRQCERYASHDAVTAIILLTALTMRLPAELNGKPVRIVSIGMGCL